MRDVSPNAQVGLKRRGKNTSALRSSDSILINNIFFAFVFLVFQLI